MTELRDQNILVTGGAGYIGSHTCRLLALGGYLPITYDNMSTGNPWAVKWGPLIEADILDTDTLTKTIRDYGTKTIIHFAAKAYVDESMTVPLSYYQNNVVGTISLLEAAKQTHVRNLIFSSSCAVYGQPESVPVTEDTPVCPISPYGRTKAISEQIIKDVCETHKIKYALLRYFNAAGAEPESGIGECHDPETHLIPNAISSALTGYPFRIYGTQHATKDGTCIRDYVHVTDLANAHLKSCEHLNRGATQIVANLGNGTGHSILEILKTIEKFTGSLITKREVTHRNGDPGTIYADGTKAGEEIGWVPEKTDIGDIIKDSVTWHKGLIKK
jgi:UDP-glucose-4-epimerase GalE